MFQLKPENIQKYIKPWMVENNDRIRWKNKLNGELFYYEFTVTFNPNFWSMGYAMGCVGQVIADVVKPIIKDDHHFQIDYSVEYHENKMPHIHGQVISREEIRPDVQWNIHHRLTRRYGRSQWYQTGTEDMFHEKSGMKWSEYIKKDIEENEKNGMKHYYQYQFRMEI